MNPYLFLSVYLLVFFIVLPILLCKHPKRVGRFWKVRQQLSSYPKFVAIMLTLATILGNVIMFGCFPHNIGIIITTLIMLVMLHTSYTVGTITYVRNNTKATCFLAIATVGFALMLQTFPIAILFGLVLMFSCLLPKHTQSEAVATSLNESNEEATSDKTLETSDEADTTSAASIDKSKESASVTEQENQPASHTSATKPKRKKKSHKADQSSNLSRYSNGKMRKRRRYYPARHTEPTH